MNPLLRQLLEQYKEIPLSGEDVKKLLDGKVKIIKYPDIHKFDNIDELIHPYDCAIILYEYYEHYGHWCWLIMTELEDGSKTLEFGDPYGKTIDYVLTKIPEPYKSQSNQDYPYLTRLMYNSPYECSYNDFKFQKIGDKISTCGRWSTLRCLLKQLPLAEFKKLFYGEYSDDLATFLTSNRSQVEEVK
jgi:hypothetical protein